LRVSADGFLPSKRKVEQYLTNCPLIDPAKLSTLSIRGANPRVQKAVYWLEMARRKQADPGNVLDAALHLVGVTGKAAELTLATNSPLTYYPALCRAGTRQRHCKLGIDAGADE